ncbi:MAG: pyridoxal phosphate-dependent aminotransferase [Candidatus Kaiserbacteria bacterium]|nr:pyridoxal phosphate-dependent aminotransferase [Candidatus Kaiserbacteria bacterium]MCB9815856.1 pyridoxal phosphate-dependent aminotransferase [Candidatus Nomurabacteria bacterium]
MRRDIVHPGAGSLTYEIREIVAVGEKLRDLGVPIYWENIGDPIAKGRKMPEWIKDIVADLVANDDSSWGYSPTKGVLSTREYIAKARNAEGGVEITANDILFFNGLGDAIQTIFMYLNQSARVLGPNPAYSTHSSAEAAHARSEHLTYDLLPENGWLPDLEDLYRKVKYNPSISGILIINPDNPTGTVYPEKVLRGIVDIAREFDLFIMSDEIYASITYGETPMCPLSKVLGDVPGMALKGLSKEIPWPGSRCGWVEFYNQSKDENFATFANSIVHAKQLEVCSTTLPQKALPLIFSHEKYPAHLKEVATEYAKKAEVLAEILNKIEGLSVVKPQGAFYASPLFAEGVLRNDQTLPIEDDKVRAYVEGLVKSVPNDKRFVYYLLGATGICVVPLSGMNSHREGFRMTMLEPDEKKFKDMVERLAAATAQYLQS